MLINKKNYGLKYLENNLWFKLFRK